MPPDSNLTLANDFESPDILARLHALLVLAKSLQAHLRKLWLKTRDCYPADFLQVVGTFAERFGAEIGRVTDVHDLIGIWDQACLSGMIKYLPRGASRELKEIRESLASDVRQPSGSLGYLVCLNHRAHAWIQTLLSAHQLEAFLSPAPAPVRVDYDPNVWQYCVSSVRTENLIQWSFQPVQHSLWAALGAERVFEHEYFSHLVPRNEFLSDLVREGWLVEALADEHRNADKDREQSKADQVIWNQLTRQLAKHAENLPEHIRAKLQPLVTHASSFRTIANRVRLCSEAAFWNITREILRMSRGQAPASQVDHLLWELNYLSNNNLRQVLGGTGSEKTIEEISHAVHKFPS